MKTLFKVNLDGTYTHVEEVVFENNETAKAFLEDYEDEYFKTFSAAKKAALSHMNYMLSEWKFAVSEMKKQKKANY